jgi:uncharacterized protein (TIGR03437 family)
MKIKLTVIHFALFFTAFLSAQQTPKPVVPVDGIVNGASFGAGPVAPGSIISIFGTNLGLQLVDGATTPISETATVVPLATSLGGQTVRFTTPGGSFDAPLFFVSGPANQMNAQVPWELSGQSSAQLTVRSKGSGDNASESDPVTVQVGAASPAIFAIGTRAVAVNVKASASDDVINGSFAHEAGAIAGVENQPAAIGGVVTLYVNGLGPVTPTTVTGAAASTTVISNTDTPATVTVDDKSAQVLFSGLAPGFVGLYQVNMIVPEGVSPRNEVPVRVGIGNTLSPSNITIGVRAKP